MNFSGLTTGDVAIFTQSFKPSDFNAFALLSRDNNDLHHDNQYAQQSGYLSPIVPIHLTSLPLSRVAGCIFPGQSSLYLKNSVTALSPVYYDNDLIYSAKIKSKSESARLITVENVCFNNSLSNIAFVAEMVVKSRHDDTGFSLPTDVKYIPSTSKKALILLGASSAIGSSIAIELAKMNYELILVYNKKGRIFSDLLFKLDQMRCKHSVIQADFSSAELDSLARTLKEISSGYMVQGVIQCACPNIFSSLDLHIKIGYQALKACVESILPSLICRQDGIVAFISSIATERFQGPSWDSYIMGKIIADKYLQRISSDYSRYGLRCISLMPSGVDTDFIDGLDLNRENLLSPIQVANEFARELKENSRSGVLVVEPTITLWKDFASSNDQALPANLSNNNLAAADDSRQNGSQAMSDFNIVVHESIESKLIDIFASVFRLAADDIQPSMSISNTPKWDSLNHLTLVSEIESRFSICFSASEIQEALSFQSLKKILLAKM